MDFRSRDCNGAAESAGVLQVVPMMRAGQVNSSEGGTIRSFCAIREITRILGMNAERSAGGFSTQLKCGIEDRKGDHQHNERS